MKRLLSRRISVATGQAFALVVMAERVLACIVCVHERLTYGKINATVIDLWKETLATVVVHVTPYRPRTT